MKKSDFEYLNKLMAVIDSCNVDSVVILASNWSIKELNDSVRGQLLKTYADKDWSLILKQKDKESILSILATYFTDYDFYHADFIANSRIIGYTRDHCEVVVLNPICFTLTDEHYAILDDSEVLFNGNISLNPDQLP